MDRNMRSSYVNSGPRSLPHFGSKRHGAGGHNGARLSPPAQPPPPPPPHHQQQQHQQQQQHSGNPQDEIISYIYESWNKVTRELDRGSEDARYYQEVIAPRQLANFRPFNLEEWWARRLLQSINRSKHRS